MEIRFIMVFTKLICLNDFYPLCPFVRGFVALWFHVQRDTMDKNSFRQINLVNTIINLISILGAARI